MTDEPLIYTKRGNLPASLLTYETAWDVQVPHFVKFVERYRAADGEVVREDAHVYAFQGVTAEGVAASIG